MILIERKRQRQLVESIEGYKGWKVVARDVPPPPSRFARWEDGQWVEDAEAKARAEQQASWRAMDKAELVETLLARIAEIEARVSALESR